MIVIFVLGISLDQLERIKLPTGSFFRISAAHGEAGREDKTAMGQSALSILHPRRNLGCFEITL